MENKIYIGVLIGILILYLLHRWTKSDSLNIKNKLDNISRIKFKVLNKFYNHLLSKGFDVSIKKEFRVIIINNKNQANDIIHQLLEYIKKESLSISLRLKDLEGTDKVSLEISDFGVPLSECNYD